MFETAVLSYGPPTKRVWATLAGFTGQATLIGFALLAPLLWPQVIPKVAWAVTVVGPPPPPPPPPPGGDALPKRARVIPVQSNGTRLFIPASIPTRVKEIVDPDELASGPGVPGGVIGGVPGGVSDGVMGGILNATSAYVPVIKPPEVVKPVGVAAPVNTVTVAPRRISQLQLATPIRRVDPIYPALARQTRISGVVELVGVLGTDGRIRELRVLRGHPLLIEAAMAAVKQWLYAPTMLNGEPVEVQAPIQVNFILNH